jgi:Mlc titration factor MtfA (ptsG expression regulator)
MMSDPLFVLVLLPSPALVAKLPADQQLRLKSQSKDFLLTKRLIGCAGLTVTEQMRVTMAARVNLPLQVGVVLPHCRALLGESRVEGQVISSWMDAARGGALPPLTARRPLSLTVPVDASTTVT